MQPDGSWGWSNAGFIRDGELIYAAAANLAAVKRDLAEVQRVLGQPDGSFQGRQRLALLTPRLQRESGYDEDLDHGTGSSAGLGRSQEAIQQTGRLGDQRR